MFRLQRFSAPTGTITTADLAPAISIDYTSKIASNIRELQRLLGIADLTPMANGSQIKLYKTTVGTIPAQVLEGEQIALTKVERDLDRTISLTLKKYRKATTAEAIQMYGRDLAVNKTDEALVKVLQKEVKKTLFATLNAGTGTASGTTMQATLANVWAELQEVHEDEDVSPIYFANPVDVATYLGTAAISTQTAFGFSYLENFLGLGNVFVSPQVTAGNVIGVAAQNLLGAYIPATGDVGNTFGLTADASGIIGMTHMLKTDYATIDTVLMMGVVFAAEDADKVIVGTISSSEGGGGAEGGGDNGGGGQ